MYPSPWCERSYKLSWIAFYAEFLAMPACEDSADLLAAMAVLHECGLNPGDVVYQLLPPPTTCRATLIATAVQPA